jgi:hypothetical protein
MSSETSVLTRVTLRNVLEDAILHSHRRKNITSYEDVMPSQFYYLTGVYLSFCSRPTLARTCKSETLFLEVSTAGFISKRGEDGRTDWVVNCCGVEDKLCVNVGGKTDGVRDSVLGAAASQGASSLAGQVAHSLQDDCLGQADLRSIAGDAVFIVCATPRRFQLQCRGFEAR